MFVKRLLDRSASHLPRPVRTALDWAVTIAIAVTVVYTVQAGVAKPYRIPSSSMEPTLHCAKPVDGCRGRFSDRVLVNRLAYRFRDPRRGEEVVFDTPARAAAACQAGGTFVKRIVGLPGERVTMDDGKVFVNGRPLDETYVLSPAQRGSESGTWPRVPPDGYFVLGDNRAQSCDSRRWGTVPRENLIGPVMFTYWPPGRVP